MEMFCYLLGSTMSTEAVGVVYIVFLCIFSALFICGAIAGCYFFGKILQKNYHVPGWYFWSAYIFAVPVIVAPLVLFLSCFIDNPKNDDNAFWAFLLFNTYSFWLIGGFMSSIKLYRRYPHFLSLFPSVMSWLCVAGIFWWGFSLIG
ncbi:MAG: hypothetical protein ACI308_10220 [Muribaculaceae bacterium]